MATFNADALNDDDAPEPALSKQYAQLEDPDIDLEDDGLIEDDLSEGDIEAKIADAAQQDEEPVKPETPTSTAVATIARMDVSTLGEDWEHDWLEFKGDKLGIRLPTRQALAAFSLASSKYVDMQVKNDLTGLFIARHLSPESYGRVFSRLMDPDENDYTVDTVGELFNAIVTAAIKAD
jgi:hypothetical protein